MMRRLLRACALLALALALPALAAQEGPAASQEAPAPTDETFDELRALVLPGEDELAWRGRGWIASLWEGVIEAQRSEKPILLWAMNGHPLGCT